MKKNLFSCVHNVSGFYYPSFGSSSLIYYYIHQESLNPWLFRGYYLPVFLNVLFLSPWRQHYASKEVLRIQNSKCIFLSKIFFFAFYSVNIKLSIRYCSKLVVAALLLLYQSFFCYIFFNQTMFPSLRVCSFV